jgi:tetratricopeptide (TPR) repeat protein
MVTDNYWRQLSDTKKLLKDRVTQDVQDALSARPPGPRDEAGDNGVFKSLTQATASAFEQNDLLFAIDLFDKCFALVCQYEQRNNCEVHKGAMTFNVALAYLQVNDFAAAMHYFELAQRETRTTRGEEAWEIYDFGLFQHNFWKTLDLYEQESPLLYHNDFWGIPFSAAEARQVWNSLSEHSRLLYIMVNAERISYRRLMPQPNVPRSESFSLSHWNLIADLSRLIETELGNRGMAASGLRASVLTKVNGPLAGFKHEVTALNTKLLVHNSSDYNTHFPAYRIAIADAGRARESRIAAAALFAGVTRNQVQHQVDASMVIFTDRAAATFTADVLLSLCRIDRWAHP